MEQGKKYFRNKVELKYKDHKGVSYTLQIGEKLVLVNTYKHKIVVQWGAKLFVCNEDEVEPI